MKLTLWGSVNNEGKPVHASITYAAWSRQSFKLTLTGSIPPRKPTTCAQQASATGKLCHAFKEVETVAGIYTIQTTELVGNLVDTCCPYLPGQPPPK